MKNIASLLIIVALATAWMGLKPAKGAASTEASVNVRVELDRPVFPADSREKVIVKVALDGVRPVAVSRRAPVNLALVIDKSGSMGGSKIENARAAALEAVRRLTADDVVSLVVYDNDVEVLVPARRVGNGEVLAAAIENIQASGGTNLHGGVVAGAAELRKHIEEGYTHRVLLISDGQANVGPQTPAALGSLGSRLVREGISVSTIGLGLDFNEDLMARLASRSDGNTYFVQQSRDLVRIFNEELGDILSIVARRVVVEVSFPQGVRPVRLIGREGRIEERRAVIELNQLYGGQEKFVLIEAELEPGTVGTRREIARAEVRYENAVDAKAVKQSAGAEALFSAVKSEVVNAANQQVQADYAKNILAEAKDEVVALVDSGQRFEAGARLREAGTALGALGRDYNNTAVLSSAAPAAAEAAKVENEGLSNAERKNYRAKAQQTYSQQRAE